MPQSCRGTLCTLPFLGCVSEEKQAVFHTWGTSFVTHISCMFRRSFASGENSPLTNDGGHWSIMYLMLYHSLNACPSLWKSLVGQNRATCLNASLGTIHRSMFTYRLTKNTQCLYGIKNASKIFLKWICSELVQGDLSISCTVGLGLHYNDEHQPENKKRWPFSVLSSL